jgi:hypothetical protein
MRLAALAILVILIFLQPAQHADRSLSIPISIVCAFVLYFNNLSLNVFTLGGLAWASGLWTMPSWSWKYLPPSERRKSPTKPPSGSGEVGWRAGSTITTIVFLPVALSPA